MINLLVILLLTFLPVLYSSIRTYRLSLKIPRSCHDPPSYPHKDPFFGLDLFRLLLEKRKAHQSILFSLERHKKYGPTYQAINLGRKVIHTIQPENMKAVYGSNWLDWGVCRLKGMQPFCGHGFMTVDGREEWKRYRAMITPSLAEPNVLDFAALDVALKIPLSKIPQDGETVDMSPIFDELYLDTGLQWVLGQSLSSVSTLPSSVDNTLSHSNNKITIQEFYSAFCACQAWMGFRMAFRGIARSIPNKKWKTDTQVVHAFIDQQIKIITAQNREKAVKKSSFETGAETAQAKAQSQSLLTSLINQKATPYELRSQVLQGLLASQDSTAILLSNTIFDLSQHPSLWKRLRVEVLGLGENGKHLTEKTLRGMPFLQNIFKETLRLHPVFPNMARTALHDTILPTGGGTDGSSPIFVAAGSDVMTNFYSLHRDSGVFGPAIETFNPDRWTGIAPTRWEYMAFGGGPRGCGGQHKALMEASLVVVRLAQRFARLKSRDEREWTGVVRLLASNVNGCKVAFHSKEEEG